MARFALRIWSAIISAFAVLAVHAPGNSAVVSASADLAGVTAERSRKPELFLEKGTIAAERNMVIARGGGHASHSSHGSHASHASHYSGYGSSGTSSRTTYTDDSTTSSVGTDASETSSRPSKTSVPTVDGTGSAVKIKKSDSRALVGVNAWINVERIFFKNGDVISCDYAWKEGTSLKVFREGNVLTFELSTVDEAKTFL